MGGRYIREGRCDSSLRPTKGRRKDHDLNVSHSGVYHKADKSLVMNTKTIFLCLIFFATRNSGSSMTSIVVSTEPQKIVSITQELHELEYYETQVGLWDNKIKADSKDADAWMNYYLACRIVNMLTPQRNPHDLDDIFNDITTEIPSTYEFHYLTYLNGRMDMSLYSHLERAFELDPSRAEVLSHLVNYHAIKGNEAEMTKYNKLWLESGEISTGILNWNYNALIALEENAILLTYGDNDTYPTWMLQQVHDLRQDVKVVNIHLLRKREYIDHVFSACGIKRYPSQQNEEAIWDTDLVPVVDHIFQHTERPVYINVTLPKKIRDNYRDVLYTVGLAFKYSVEAFDNMATLKNNYENKFLTDYLRMGFSYDKSVTVLNSLNVNYLPAFVSLYKHYMRGEEEAKAEQLKQVIYNIGAASGREDEVAKVLEPNIGYKRKIKSHMNIKQLDKKMKKVRPGLWAASVETTNASYEQFLLDLLKEKEFDLLETCKATKIDWLSMLPEVHGHEEERRILENGGGDWPEAPVTNISYEAAVAYCEWLTMVYNGHGKRKKHKEVLFRLPTEEEWEYAALGGKEAAYPWGGYYYKNLKGCYLANFYSSDEDAKPNKHGYISPGLDGGIFLVHADAYFPNEYGLYNTSGNAAEMVQGGLVAKGGSWEDLPADCTIQSKKKINGPSPSLGFRVFMEVIH